MFPDIVAAHYSPWGFLSLSHGACQPLFEELLLLLQPLSLLPFDLDLLFEPHLLQKGRDHLRRKEQLCSAGHNVDRSSRSTFQLMRGWSTTVSDVARDSSAEAEARKDRTGLRREGTWPRMEGAERRREAAGVKWRLRSEGETTESATSGSATSIWKEKCEADDIREKDRRRVKGREAADECRHRQDRQAGWWYQLMQSSQVYIDQSAEGSKFVKAEKRKKSSERRQGQPPPTREGVVEGAESSQEGDREKSSESAGSRRRPSWMGSPPESVLNQEKDSDPQVAAGTEAQTAAQEQSPSQGQSLRWGRLFGSKLGSPARGEAEQKTKVQKTR